MDTVIPAISAGLVSSIICNPLDVLRINKQINRPTQLNIRNSFKGLGVGMLTIPTFWVIYFPLYNINKDKTGMRSSLNAYMSSCLASTVTTPLWVIKQKAQTDKLNEMSKMTIPCFYSGLFPTYLINLSFAVQIPLYEYLKSVSSDNHTFTTFINAAISKTVATCIFYPLDTIRVTYRNGGLISGLRFLDFYRGINIYLMRSIPYHTSVFCTFEFVKNLM